MTYRFCLAVTGLLFLIILALTHLGFADVCYAPDRGDGTVVLPADCSYIQFDRESIEFYGNYYPVAGLSYDIRLNSFANVVITPGGTLGGEVHQFDAELVLDMVGYWDLEGYSRVVAVPVAVEAHCEPRSPGDECQTHAMTLVSLHGETLGDPDFCVLRVEAGENFGLTSDGAVELLRLPGGDYTVDSYFDITYRLEIEGCPASQMEGYSAVSVETGRWRQGGHTWFPGDAAMGFPQDPDETGWDVDATSPLILCDEIYGYDGWLRGIHFWGAWKGGLEAEQLGFRVSIAALILPDGDLYRAYPGEVLWIKDIYEYTERPGTSVNPEDWLDTRTGTSQEDGNADYFQYDILLDSVDWLWLGSGFKAFCISALVSDENPNLRWGWRSSLKNFIADALWSFVADTCYAPDRGDGTIDLPADCQFISQESGTMDIIDGLAPGDEINGSPVLRDFSNIDRTPGTSPIDEIIGFDAVLDLTMEGSGGLEGFDRNLTVPVEVVIRTNDRSPQNPVQNINAEVFSLNGELFGDPDFCLFRVSGGGDLVGSSAGLITLILLPSGEFRVESSFDVAYQIEFSGCPGSQLEGLAGTTIGTCRMGQGLPASGWTRTTESPSSVDRLGLAYVLTGGNYGDCCLPPTVGDVDHSGGVDITDISLLIDNQFLSLSPLVCEAEGDIDLSGEVDIIDLSILIDNQFLTLTPLPPCP